MKMAGKYDVSSKGGGCAGLALDAKNNILFAACRDNKNMIICRQPTGTSLPICPSGRVRRRHLQPRDHGGLQFAGRWHAHRSQGEFASPASLWSRRCHAGAGEVLTLDTKTNQIFTITAEYGPVPAAPANGTRLPRRALQPGCAGLGRL